MTRPTLTKTTSRLGTVLLALIACSPAPAGPTTVPATTGIAWGDPTAIVEPQPGWTAHACEGDAPLICVTGPGDETGLVEVIRFPGTAGADEEASLLILADDFVASIRADRLAGCGDDYQVEALGTSDAVVSGASGLRFGFIGRTGDGAVSERNVQHAVMEGDDVVIITAAAYAAGGCPGRDDQPSFEPEALESFDRGLSALVAGLPLP